MPLALVITTAGRNALVNAAGDGTRAVRIVSAGVSATAIVASPAATTLPGEIKRIASLSGDAIADDIMHLVIRDETMQTYTLRSFALYLDDGTLFALYGQADPIIEKSAQAVVLLAIDVALKDVSATQIEFGDAAFILPPATTERTGMVELATPAEVAAGTDPARAVTPYTLRVSFADVWRASNDGAGSGLDADLLDGRQASEFALLTGAAFAGTLLAPTLAVDGPAGRLSIFNRGNPIDPAHGWTIFSAEDSLHFVSPVGEQLSLHPFTGASFAGTLRQAGSPVWHRDNDGSGSGMDADLLDGRQGAEYALLAGSVFTGPVSATASGGPALTANINQGGQIGLFFSTTFAGGNSVQLNPFVSGVSNDGFEIKLGPTRYFSIAGSGIATFAGPVQVRHADRTCGLRVAQPGTGYGLIQCGESADATRNWHFGSADSGTFDVYQGHWGSGILRLQVTTVDVRFNGAILWNSANDGAGSGLDADLLDGQQGAWYADVAARLGYAPASRAGDTFAGPVQMRHEDRICGLRIAQLGTGYGMMQMGESADLSRNWHIGSADSGSFDVYQGSWGSGTMRLQVTSVDVRFNAAIMWHAANDGAGSGLDADLLDGRHAADFVLASDPATFGSNANGYWERRANGVIEQWGTIAGRNSEGAVFLSFPIPFTDLASINLQAIGVNLPGSERYDMVVQQVGLYENGATLFCQYTAAPNSQAIISQVQWRAIGR